MNASKEALSKQLVSWNLDAETPSSEDELIQALHQNTKVDLIILDYDLPNTNGILLANSIRDIEQYAGTPIVILSPLSLFSELKSNSDSFNYLIKPVTVHNFERVITEQLRNLHAPSTQHQVLSIAAFYSKKSLLLVASNELNQTLFGRIYSQLGANVTSVSQQDFRDLKVDSEDYEILVFDIGSANDLQLTEDIRLLSPNTRQVTVAINAPKTNLPSN